MNFGGNFIVAIQEIKDIHFYSFKNYHLKYIYGPCYIEIKYFARIKFTNPSIKLIDICILSI